MVRMQGHLEKGVSLPRDFKPETASVWGGRAGSESWHHLLTEGRVRADFLEQLLPEIHCKRH